MQILNFVKTIRIKKPSQQYFDFIVSGESLKSMLKANARDLVTPFGWCDRSIEDKIIKEFKGEVNGLEALGRIMIYVCPECLDIGCGAITADLELTTDSVIWKNFGYENGYEEIDFDSFNHIQQLQFNKYDYLAKFSQL